MAKSVFISYSHRNRIRTFRLVESLRAHHIDVWWDQFDMLVGQRILDSIYEGIRSCDYFAIVLTKASNESAYVQEELYFAKQLELENSEVTILPLLFEKCKIPDVLAGRYYADFTNYDKGINSLLRTLGVDPLSNEHKEIESQIRINQATDQEIQELYVELEGDNYDKAFEAAKKLSRYRDPQARRVLINKLHGNPIDVSTAITGLIEYESADMFTTLLFGFSFQELIIPFVGDNLSRERTIMIKSLENIINFAGHYPTETSVLFLWGILIMSYENDGVAIDEKLVECFRKSSVKALGAINTHKLAYITTRLFGYRCAIAAIEKLQFNTACANHRWLIMLASDLKSQKLTGMILPSAERITIATALSGLNDGEFYSFQEDEYSQLCKNYDRGNEICRTDVPDDQRQLGILLYCLAQVYGITPDDEDTKQNERIFSKLDVFYHIYKNIGIVENLDSLDLNDSDDAAQAIEKRRTHYFKAALEYVNEADNERMDFTKILTR